MNKNIYSNVAKNINFLLRNLKRIMILNFAKNINLMRFIKNNKSKQHLKRQINQIMYSKTVRLNKTVILMSLGNLNNLNNSNKN